MFLAKPTIGCFALHLLFSLLVLARSGHPTKHRMAFRHDDENTFSNIVSAFQFQSNDGPRHPSLHSNQRCFERSAKHLTRIRAAPSSHSKTNSSQYLRHEATPSNNRNHRNNRNNRNNNNDHTRAQSMDRLRVELLRTRLSVEAAEDRATRFEAELRKMRGKYRKARAALGQERARNVNAGPSREERQSRGPGRRREGESGGGDGRTRGPADADAPPPPAGLPPMAAALFASAEREERSRRSRGMGLIEAADGADAGDAAGGEVGGEEDGGQGASARAGGEATPGRNATAVGATPEQNATASPSRPAAAAANNRNESSVADDAEDATARNDSIDPVKATVDEGDERTKALVRRCADLTRQQEVLQRKLSFQRRDDLSRAQTEVLPDARAIEEAYEDERGRERDEWEEQRGVFELELKCLREERDRLSARLEGLGSASHVAKLLRGLTRDKLLRAWRRRVGGGELQRGDCTPSAGASASDDDPVPGRGGWSLVSAARLSILGRGAVYGGRWDARRRGRSAGNPGPTTGTDATGPGAASTAPPGGSAPDPPVPSAAPLLVRGKRRRPRRFRPSAWTAFAGATTFSALEVPKFWREDEES